tara:strand:- start:4493 stop:5164 length:672 start_codon:yes stop_codon:yes gene_type:complete
MKTLIINKFHALQVLFLSCATSIFMLGIKLKITHEFFYLFLVWNLFLAIIPLIVVWWLQSRNSTSNLLNIAAVCIWLLFLPNSPYVITDFIHLQYSQALLADTVIIFAFAVASLFAGLLSICEMRSFFSYRFSRKQLNIMTQIIFFLCGYGIYLGRVLRYNSWDILSNPFQLLRDNLAFIKDPVNNWPVFAVTICFGIFLSAIFYAAEPFLKRLSRISQHEAQ